MSAYTHTQAADPAYIESLYEIYRTNPKELHAEWQQFFAGYEFSLDQGAAQQPLDAALQDKLTAVRDLLQAYRSRGHLLSKTNPVRPRRDQKPLLALKDFGLNDADLSLQVSTGEQNQAGPSTSLKDLIEKLHRIYVGSIGFEYMHIRNPEVLTWFKERCEVDYPRFEWSLEQKKRILQKLNDSVVLENFLHTKYVGQKRFSLEGGETLIPALDTAITVGAEQGVTSILLGMAHRGRLNVLVNTLGKPYEHLFREFEGSMQVDQSTADGDVKYHMGYASLVKSASHDVKLELLPNPSHLEAISPIVQGLARARIDADDQDPRKLLPIVIHGDAAIAGQGLVYEMVQMSKLTPYKTGGTIHFVVNNQVGFTTDFEESRSSIYCTDVAKVIDAPILHVNGDDPEAVAFCMQLAITFRQTFQKDVFVDMLCYRKYGHNESDEPRFTQPTLYKAISAHPNVRDIYANTLIERKQIDEQLPKKMDQELRALLQEQLNLVKQKPDLPASTVVTKGKWAKLRISQASDFDKQPKTAISARQISQITTALTTVPKGFQPIRQVEKVLQQRKQMLSQDKVLNWSIAELLAYGSLLLDGHNVRLVGQDSQRGTFSHRHAVLKDANTNESHNSLGTLTKQGVHFSIYNSLLSEYAALGFEFGYSSASPEGLVIWEAQFGDFANGAQIIIDQFLSTSYTKWQHMNGLVLLLPHGHEGQGPEHSSARLERFLQLSSGNNMFVCYLTEPANFFHMLRRQLKLPFRMPCVLMSPKSLFRHPQVLSPLKDFTAGAFQVLIDDKEIDPAAARKVILCTGKVYYDLYAARKADQRKDIAILRLEQLHPMPKKILEQALARYKSVSAYYWVQEEPQNMGAWSYLRRVLPELPLRLISRKSAASPATGRHKLHLEEQSALIKQALA